MTAKQVTGRKVRYAAVAAGWITQGYFMPGVEHTGNSELVALVTGDPTKADELKKKYKLDKTYDYDEYPQLLASGEIDAVYVATPNWQHAEFAVPALEAGIHVLLEKPMAVGEEDCRRITAAAEKSGAKLMIAYRLHFEPATLGAIALVRSGELGDVQLFNSSFAQALALDNHRAKHGFDAGPVYDMGPYPINAARMLFGAEPTEARAVGTRHPDLGFSDFDDTVSVTLRFPGDRLAHFVVSYALNDLDTFAVLGTKGSVVSRPAYLFGKPLAHHVTIAAGETDKKYPVTDQFGGETKYFSDCILNDVAPEPDGEEGLCDVRVIEAIRRSLETGRPEPLPPFARQRRIDLSQLQSLRAVRTPDLIHQAPPDRNAK